MYGKIKKLTDKGFGFITPEEGVKDIFFHAKNIADGTLYEDLREGDQVEFETRDSEKGPAAVGLTVIR